MSEQRAIVIPDSVDVETSTEHGFVILKVEVLLEGRTERILAGESTDELREILEGCSTFRFPTLPVEPV